MTIRDVYTHVYSMLRSNLSAAEVLGILDWLDADRRVAATSARESYGYSEEEFEGKPTTARYRQNPYFGGLRFLRTAERRAYISRLNDEELEKYRLRLNEAYHSFEALTARYKNATTYDRNDAVDWMDEYGLWLINAAIGEYKRRQEDQS